MDKTKQNKFAKLSQILGIISIPTSFIYGLGFFIGIAAIILSIVANNKIKSDPSLSNSRGKCITGIITGCIGLLIGLFAIAINTGENSHKEYLKNNEHYQKLLKEQSKELTKEERDSIALVKDSLSLVKKIKDSLEIVNKTKTALELCSTYNNNKIRADRTFKNKWIYVKGTLSKIDGGDDGVTLWIDSNKDEFLSCNVICRLRTFDKSNRGVIAYEMWVDEIAELNIGDEITIYGKCDGIDPLFSEPVLIECDIK